MEIKRDNYLQQLIDGRGNGFIKIVTGIRRCGKSYLLFTLFYNYLIEQGVAPEQILAIALDDLREAKFRQPNRLIDWVERHRVAGKTLYVLLDEVQMMNDFTGALNTLLRMPDVDVYVTGSNSKFLSSDVATEFRGRGDVIRLYPLSFAEYYSAVGGDKQEAWNAYYVFGGLPQIVALPTERKKMQYLSQLYKTVYKTDLVERHHIDKADELDELVSTIASMIGSPCNPNRIANTFQTARKVTLHPATIASYLDYLENAFLIEQSKRYDIRGRKQIGSLSKYYFTDMGLRNALLNFRQNEETHLMENIIYNELRIRGFSVDVGVVEDARLSTENRSFLEVDFVANMGSKRYYIQSALTMPNEQKLQQESRPFERIEDAFKKVIIVKDLSIPWYSLKGVLVIGLFDFLLSPYSLDY